MTAPELKKMMSSWKSQKEQLDLLETTIKTEVLKRESTFETDDATATFRKGTRKFNYECDTVVMSAPLQLVEVHTKVVSKIDWKAICSTLKIKDIPFTQSDPTVSLKVKK